MYAQALERLMLHAYIIVSKNLLMTALLMSNVLLEMLFASLLGQYALTELRTEHAYQSAAHLLLATANCLALNTGVMILRCLARLAATGAYATRNSIAMEE